MVTCSWGVVEGIPGGVVAKLPERKVSTLSSTVQVIKSLDLSSEETKGMEQNLKSAFSNLCQNLSDSSVALKEQLQKATSKVLTIER